MTRSRLLCSQNKTFPGRFHAHGGNSFDTLPRWSALPSSPKCDAMLVDGAHTADGARLDALHFRSAAACEHVAFFDDMQAPSGEAVRRLVREGSLALLEERHFEGGSEEACLRLYERRKARSVTSSQTSSSRIWWIAHMPLEQRPSHFDLRVACPTKADGWGFAIARFRDVPACSSGTRRAPHGRRLQSVGRRRSAASVAAMLMESSLAKRLMPELRSGVERHGGALRGARCNWRQQSRTARVLFFEMHHNASRPLEPHPNVYGLRLAGRPLAQEAREGTGCHDLDLGAFTQTLAPDSLYQTLMSEHAGIIALGLFIERRASRASRGRPPQWIGSSSWKHAIKGRPLPCRFLDGFNWSALRPDHVVYWGTKVGARPPRLPRLPGATSPRPHPHPHPHPHQVGPVLDFPDFLALAAREQPGGVDLMRVSHERFFDEVFSVPPGLSSHLRSQGGVAHAWSNYIVVSPALMANLAKFNVVVAAWLDLRYPIGPTRALSKRSRCPATYQRLQARRTTTARR